MRRAGRLAKTSLTPKPIFFESPQALGTWFQTHHSAKTELWVGYYKKHTGRQCLTWSEAVDEALCWGWIDSVKRGIDSTQSMQRFTPRKPNSHWSTVNVAKVAALEAAGRMQEPGREAFAKRKEENTGQMVFERGARPLSDEFAERLAEREDAAKWHAGQPPGYRRDAEDWVMSAKKEETRERRFVQFIECAEQELRVPPLRRRGT
ncbi:hypothetical protein V5O48_000915 [Marasmius crinis-equi]|uniref:Bacteriocin-protection protein n=1 Tax=Marasmius crinis-equi TaxID=585013 RepID=A0ABR3FZX1_9AGAR